jgi:hypothetical protein
MSRSHFAILGGLIGVGLFLVGYFLRWKVIGAPSFLDVVISSMIWGPLRVVGITPAALGVGLREMLGIASVVLPKGAAGFIVGYLSAAKNFDKGQRRIADAIWPLYWFVGVTEALSLIGFSVA